MKRSNNPDDRIGHLGLGREKAIQWFPGHMAKALKELKSKLQLCDLVIEVRDARAPLASANPDLDPILQTKARLIVMNKANLADPANLSQWKAWFRNQGLEVHWANALQAQSLKALPKLAKARMQEKFKKLTAKGIKPPAARMMVIGLPNTGKSSLINALAGKKATRTGAKPGVTRTQEWVLVGKDLELLDTPGIMPPKIANNKQGLLLTLLHCIKDEIPGPLAVANFLLAAYAEQNPQALTEKYALGAWQAETALYEIGQRQGMLKAGGVTDENQVASRIIRDFREFRLPPLAWELPPPVMKPRLDLGLGES